MKRQQQFLKEVSMLTSIGIAVLVLFWLFFWGKKCLIVTEAATFTVVGLWGKSPTEVYSPPWNFILYPLYKVMGIITTEVQRYNMPNCTISCQIADPNGGTAIGKLTTKEVSLAYQFYFWKQSEIRLLDPIAAALLPPGFCVSLQLSRFFEFVGFHEGKIDFASMDETLKDSLQGQFAQLSTPLSLDEAINFPAKTLEYIAKALQAEFWKIGLPVNVVSLQRNAPFEAVDDLGKAVAARAKSLAELPTKVAEAENQRRLAIITANTQREVAGIAVETARAEGDKEVVRVGKILEAFQLSALPPAERFAGLMTLEQLKVYREMAASPSSKLMLVPTDFLTKIGGALSAMTGGRP